MSGEFSPQQVQAFRYWIQGFHNFYEPLVVRYFEVRGYTVTRPATIRKPELERLAQDLFDGRRSVGREVPVGRVIELLRGRRHLRADALLEGPDGAWLLECKSWGGSGLSFNEEFAVTTFVKDPRNAAFLLLERACGKLLAGKILVLAPSPAGIVARALEGAFNTTIRVSSLDEVLQDPQVRPALQERLAFLDAAVGQLKESLLERRESDEHVQTQALD
jgi:hypothetical protein